MKIQPNTATRFMAIGLSWLMCMSPMAAVGNASEPQQGNAGERRNRDGEMLTGLEKRTSSADLVSENLARVAARPEQILGILNKDSGLMMEFKTLYARDAGLRGQLLEEADLTDGAIAEKIRQDLHLRVLATKLLQRYGYLQAQINPNSEMAAERLLYLKQQAMEMQRAAASQALVGQLPLGNAGCEPRGDLNCLMQTLGAGSGAAQSGGAPAPSPKQQENQPPDYSNGPAELRAANTQGGTLETLLASAQSDGTAAGALNGMSGSSVASRNLLASLAGSQLPTQGSQADALAALAASSSGASTGKVEASPASSTGPARSNGTGAGGIDVDQLIATYRSGQPTTAELEPVRMVRQANPYASVPALYDLYVQAAANNRPAQRFGLDVFQRGAAKTDFLPMDMPVGPDYVVGPGDGLAIDLWGSVSQRFTRTVDREGRVSLPEAGPILVSGRSLGDVQEEVQRILRTQFRDVSADVSLLRLRTVRVYVVGEVAAPGAYDISSLSTPLNALFTAGGVTARGSLRQLEHYRGNDLVEKVDAYDLLLHGVRGDMQRLESGDSLRVPPVGPMVTVDGMVRRPAIYELRNEKNLEDILDLAGGILPAAALRHIEVQRLMAHEKRTMFSLDLGETSDVEALREEMQHFKVQDGDQIHIFPIAPYNTAAVYLEGHVLRPGRYSYHEGMTLADLVGSYKDLLPEPAGNYAEIIRLKSPDYRPVVESFDLTKALENPESAPKLQPLDTVRIYGRYDFEAAPEIFVSGEVRNPGRYGKSGQQHLRDVVFQAGGLTPDAWLESAQVFRVQPDGTTKVFSINLREAISGNPLDNLLLEPRDRVLVHRHPELEEPRTVMVQGDVVNPGRYPLAANMHASDLIRAAGGLLRSANPAEGALTRYVPTDGAKQLATPMSTENVPVNVMAALEGNEENDVALRAGDVLTVPERPGWKDIGASVGVRGEVRRPGTYGIRPGERLSSVLERAGGFNGNAYPYGAVLTRHDVLELEMKSHDALVQRLKYAQMAIKGLPENTEDQRNMKLVAMAQTETTLQALEENAPIGRVVMHIGRDLKEWKNTPADPVLQKGDVVVIPKKANYVTVTGQVFNPTSVSYQPGRSAQWYLKQAGGFTQLSNRSAAFIIHADGSVVAAKNNSGWWSGNPLHTVLKPGDAIIVPEKSPNISIRNWTVAMQMSQIAASAAFAAAYILK